MGKSKLVIIEGAQGTGKSTVSSILREHMTYTNLMRLTGIEDSSKAGKSKVYSIRLAELRMIEASKNCGVSFILDRSFLTEAVYCKLGFKDYLFGTETLALSSRLNALTEFYDIHVIVLTATPEEFIERLKRDKPNYMNLNFSADSSMRQQEAYIRELKILERAYKSINCLEINTTNINPHDIVYDLAEAIKRS